MNYSEYDYRDMFDILGFETPKGTKGLVRCPCHTDKHPSMSIDVSKGLFNCFSCHYHGRIDMLYYETYGSFYGKKTTFSDKELRRLFERKEKPRILQTQKQFFTASMIKRKDPIMNKWLEYRGIKPSVADESGVFYGDVNISFIDEKTGKEKQYTVHDRVMFPIFNENRKMCSIEMRFPFFGNEPQRFIDTVPKVLYPKCSSVNLLYEPFKLDKTKKLYILEGLMDCLSFRSLTNYKNTTSIFGAAFTEHQKELLKEFPEICYVYNNDLAGENSVKEFKNFYKGKITLLKPYGNYDDVGDMAKDHFGGVEEWLKTEH